MTFEEYAQKHLGTAGLSFEGIELVRMGWNARGTYGDANEAGVVGHEYSQGICSDGSAILKDGQPMTIEQIIQELQVAQPNHIADDRKMVKGDVSTAGSVILLEGKTYERAIVVAFESDDDLRAAIAAGQCRFTVFGGEG